MILFYNFSEGITMFLNALYGLNNALVADVKWRYYCAEQLPRLPARFSERLQEVLIVNAFSESDIERRRLTFMEMWQEVLPWVEAEVNLSYGAFSLLV